MLTGMDCTLKRVVAWLGISRAFLADSIMAHLRGSMVGITITYCILAVL